MLPLPELTALASHYKRDRSLRLAAPRAAAVRDQLARARRALRQAADGVADVDRHAAAVAGVDLAEVRELHETIESFAARFGSGAVSISELGANGRRRLLDYKKPPPKFNLVRAIADRLDEPGVPLGGKDTGALYDHAHEALHLAGEDEPSRGLSKVVAGVILARKNRPAERGVSGIDARRRVMDHPGLTWRCSWPTFRRSRSSA